MRINSYIILSIALLAAVGCRSTEEELLFDQTADERVAQATNDLRQKLAAPANGWVMRYRPVPESGTYNVLLNFDADGGVRIRTDFGVNDNEFYDQLNTYRIDNSLGLELIFETYSFFSYLFEQDGATFEAEYEFNFVNETPDGALVFSSKTDLTALTVLALEPAPDNAEALLGRELNANLETLSASLGVVSPVYRLDYAQLDLSLYLSLNTNLRTINFTYASSTTRGNQSLNFTSGYLAEGNQLVLAQPFQLGNFFGTEINISAITLNELVEAGTVESCGEAVAIQQYQGTIAESNTPIVMLPALFDPAGETFPDSVGTYLANPGDIYDNGVSVGARVRQDIDGMIGLVLYNFGGGDDPLVAVGFGIVSNDELVVPVRDYTPVYTGNQIEFNLEDEYRIIIGDTTATIQPVPMNDYLMNLTEGGQTRILQSGPGVYEFFNPCTGWSAILQKL
ncbi:MAG: DUF4302 domain-containing protein [Tunicatimonas sp.]